MPSFIYKIITKENVTQKGTIRAFTKRAVVRTLERDGATILFMLRDETARTAQNISFSRNFSKTERITFFRNLAAMLAAGISVSESFRVLQDQIRNQHVKRNLEQMIRDIENGSQLSVAMERFPRLFSTFLVEAVRVGELTGRLTATLDRVSSDLERDHELQRDVKAQLAYPAVVVVVMTGVMGVMMFYVLPKIASLFEESNIVLPLPTRVLLNTGAILKHHPFEVAGIVIGLAVMLALVLRNKRGRYAFHYGMLKMPLFGELIKEANLVPFFRALESLFGSGTSLLRAMGSARKTVMNDAYRKALDETQPLLLHGVPLSDALKPYPFLFPLQAQRMIEVGERSGKLDEAFGHLILFYERSLRHRTKTMTTLIEPVLMVVVGLIVGGLALSIFLPIYQSMYQIF